MVFQQIILYYGATTPTSKVRARTPSGWARVYTITTQEVTGMVAHAIEGDLPEEYAESVRAAWERLRGSMPHWSDEDDRRGPRDYEDSQRDFESLLKGAIAEGIRRANVQINNDDNHHRHERGSGGKNAFQAWMLGLFGVLTAAGVVGGVVMYGKITAFEATLNAVKSEVSELHNLVRYRGG